MAIGWLTLLKSVPWSEVISNAPMVADGAKKLWKTVSRKSSAPCAGNPGAQSSTVSGPQALAALETRSLELEATVSDLQRQMLASSELIKTLAEQNAQLVERIESNRIHMLWLSAAIVLLAATSGASLYLVLDRF
jgi:hypothetical protein